MTFPEGSLCWGYPSKDTMEFTAGNQCLAYVERLVDWRFGGTHVPKPGVTTFNYVHRIDNNGRMDVLYQQPVPGNITTTKELQQYIMVLLRMS
jgi:hypothetical protein